MGQTQRCADIEVSLVNTLVEPRPPLHHLWTKTHAKVHNLHVACHFSPVFRIHILIALAEGFNLKGGYAWGRNTDAEILRYLCSTLWSNPDHLYTTYGPTRIPKCTICMLYAISAPRFEKIFA